MFKILNKDTNSNFRISFIALLTITVILLFLLSYFVIKTSVKDMQEDISNKFDSIEHTVHSEISDAKHVIYGLAASLSQESITLNNKHVNELVNNFDPRSGYDRSIPFSGLILLDKNGAAVANTVSSEFHAKLEIEGHPACSENNSKRFFELQVTPIRQGIYIRELIMPISMNIADLNHKHVGIICTGLIIRELNDKLSLRYAQPKYLSYIKLQNNENYVGSRYTHNELHNVFSISSVLKNYLQHKSIVVLRHLSSYPFTIEIEIKPEYLKKFLGMNLIFSLGYMIIFIVFSFLLWLITRNFFQDSLYLVHKKLNILNGSIKSTPADMLSSPEQLLVSKFCPINFARDVECLIDHYYLLQLNAGEIGIKQSELEIKKKILNLILTEQHFLPASRSAATPQERLYLNKLISIVYEEYTTMPLMDFLKQITNYCCEFYHELNIKIIVHKKDQKEFTFKHAALTETIFHIFTFISRGKFDTDNSEFILRGSFTKKSAFPSITIAAAMHAEYPTALGWSSGPAYVYTSLLSIYLLARENKLFFNITKKDDKMLFTLEPIDKKIHFYNQAFDLDLK